MPSRKYEDINTHRSKLYHVWCAMRQRCNNPANKDFKWYGAEGKTICEEWDDFNAFKRWAQQSGYREGLTIDRVESDKGYSPNNCRWITLSEQQSNRRDARLITFNGETHSMTTWAKITGLKRETIRDRIDKSGWSVEDALTTPLIPNDRTRNLFRSEKHG